jgi:uncharacterized membrane protein
MERSIKILGHPVHQMLIVFPLGLLATSAVFDAATLFSGDSRWTNMAFFLIGSGVAAGLVAAIFGLADYLGIPAGTRAKRIGALHGLSNFVVLLCFGASWLLRLANPAGPGRGAYLLSAAGVVVALVAGWLGGELVNRLGVGVDSGANLNAPSSLHGPIHRQMP